MRRWSILMILSLLPLLVAAEPADDSRLDWFRDAKLGIFIHWGIYAVDGVSESWSFHNGHVSHEQYMAQLDGFTAERFDPDGWADLIRRSGARYAVLTAKHHDGVTLWDSEHTDLSVVGRTPAGRDLLAPYCQSLRDAGLKVGLYYSLIDWSDPRYPNFLREQRRYTDQPERWADFTRANRGQIDELSRRYQPDLVWFDGDWEFSAEEWQAAEIRAGLLADNPDVIINSRLRGYGDYATPEQGLPVVRPEAAAWELCLTMNTSWGYYPTDLDYKTPDQIIRIFTECLHLGGNLLLDIGPRADGTICDEQVTILEALGRWTDKHGEAIYGTRAGLPPGHYHGASTVSADARTLYLFMPHQPRGPLMLKGLVSEIAAMRVVGSQGAAPIWEIHMARSWSDVPGVVFIDVPATALDQEMTVVAVELDEPLRLYRDGVGVITSN